MAQRTPLAPFTGGAHIPEALKAQKRWAPWVTKWLPKARGGEGKWDKRPGLGRSTAKPNTWLTYDAALAELKRHPGKYAGLGFVTTGQQLFVGIDLDHCVHDGVIAPWALEIIRQLDSYAEISPSGTGVRIMVLGQVPNDWTNHERGIEVYGGNTSRFLTFTGAHIPDSPADVRQAQVGVLAALETRYAKERTKADVIDISMPDLLDDLCLPSLDGLGLNQKALDFLRDGTAGADRSLTLFATAVSLYAAGLSDAEAFSMLVNNEHAWTLAMEKRGEDHDKALLYLWRHHCCKGRAKVAGNKALTLADFDALTGPEPEAVAPALGGVADDFEVIGEASGPAPAKAAKEARFRVKSPSEFMKRPKTQWLVKGILPQAELCVLFGNSGSGKSFLALDMMGAIARGAEWRGRKTKQGRSVYVASEDANGFTVRLGTYAQHFGLDVEALGIGMIDDTPNLADKADIKDLIAALKTFGKVDIVWIDTLAKSFQGNENSGEDMTRVLSHCALIHRVTGALVVLIAHSGKDTTKGVRGWSGLRGAADVQIEVVRSGDHRAAIIDKQKNGPGEGDEYRFKLESVVLGVDEDGEEINSCVVDHTERGAPVAMAKMPKGANERLVLKVLADMGDLDAGAVPEVTLLATCASQMAHSGTGRDRRGELARRALNALQAAGRVSISGGEVVALV